ncbi:unnamed protein product [Ilex paraguariensis]|uniref:Uncharacterized protein n=1 Tax=Ilex paraguariensis TaxID=185542 RepID=A0ABC8SYQ5_9AQUA
MGDIHGTGNEVEMARGTSFIGDGARDTGGNAFHGLGDALAVNLGDAASGIKVRCDAATPITVGDTNKDVEARITHAVDDTKAT